jgi:uncharacterized protein YkwD
MSALEPPLQLPYAIADDRPVSRGRPTLRSLPARPVGALAAAALIIVIALVAAWPALGATQVPGRGPALRPAAPRAAVHHAHRTHSHRAGRTAAGASCPGAGAAASPGTLAAMRTAVLCLVNHQRTSRGLPALREDPRLDRSAQIWSGEMVASGQFTHGADFAARITDTGFDWSQAGENIATGFPTPAAVVAGWMASPGHCRNILDPNFSAIGIGEVGAPVSGFASGPATWTQDFALPMGANAPSRNAGPQNGCPYGS